MPSIGAEAYIAADTTTIMRTEAERVLDLARSLIVETAPDVDAEFVVEYGAPGNVLTEEAKGAAVLVIGSDDLPWFERFLGGELSGHLARTASCPVVVVPEEVPAGSGDGGVVVTIDGETSAAGPLRYAFEQADARGEQLHVLYAAPAGTLDADLERYRATLAQVVAGWQEQFPGIDVLRSTSAGGASELCIEATAHAGLVVMGRHQGRSPFALVRPIARAVLRDAQCPVVVVPLDYGRDRTDSMSD
jgi:nucleotide-binding universal stress UspA family protein